MSLVVTEAAERAFLGILLNGHATENILLKLYASDTTPSDGDTVGDYLEARFSGYAPATLSTGFWTVETIDGTTTAVYARQTFSADADQPTERIYGYYLLGEDTGLLYWAERFPDGPYPVTFVGDAIRVTAKLQLSGRR